MKFNSTEQWERFLSFIADNLPAEQFDAWFKPIAMVKLEGRALTINVPSPYFVEMLESRYAPLMKSGLTKIYGDDIELYYQYFQVSNQPDSQVEMRGRAQSPAVRRREDAMNPFERADKSMQDFDSQLNPRYTFENFCGGLSNKVARSIGEAIANDPRCRTFNPLFIFGPSGVGKTHLIQAIGLRIKERNPELRVLYVSSRVFESQYTQYAKDKINEFLHFYQSIDVLIIDDIQDLIGKVKTQNAFYFIFNHLIQNSRQLIMSSDCRPSEMEGMEARLLTRFKQGMTAELDRPDEGLRRDVLRLKAAQDGLKLSPEVIDYIARNVTDSIRELEGIVVSLVAHATVLNCDIDVDLARTVIDNAIKVRKREVSFELIAEVVCSYYEVDEARVFSTTRKREVSDARQVLMYLSKKHTNLTYKAIGKHFNRCHATVMHGFNTTTARISVDKQLRSDIEAIEKQLDL